MVDSTEVATQDELIALITDPGLRARVVSGELLVSPGQVGKPVLRDVTTKQFVKGSGRHPLSPDSAMVGRKSGFKRRKTYREALEHIISVEGDGYGTYAWVIEQLLDIADGQPQLIECPHPELHEHIKDQKHWTAFKKDPTLLFRITELMAGSAAKTASVDITQESVEVHVNVEDIPFEVYRKDPLEVGRIREAVEDNIDKDDDPDVLEGDFTEVEDESA